MKKTCIAFIIFCITGTLAAQTPINKKQLAQPTGKITSEYSVKT